MEVTQKNEIQSRTNVSRSTSCPSKIRPSLIAHIFWLECGASGGSPADHEFSTLPGSSGAKPQLLPHLSASLPSDNLTAKGQFIIAGQVADVFPLPFSQVASPHSPH